MSQFAPFLVNDWVLFAHPLFLAEVDAYRNEEEKNLFLDWVLTAKTYGTPEFWKKLISEANYKGDYYWTIL